MEGRTRPRLDDACTGTRVWYDALEQLSRLRQRVGVVVWERTETTFAARPEHEQQLR